MSAIFGIFQCIIPLKGFKLEILKLVQFDLWKDDDATVNCPSSCFLEAIVSVTQIIANMRNIFDNLRIFIFYHEIVKNQ
jgi:hypothetical protein